MGCALTVLLLLPLLVFFFFLFVLSPSHVGQTEVHSRYSAPVKLLRKLLKQEKEEKKEESEGRKGKIQLLNERINIELVDFLSF